MLNKAKVFWVAFTLAYLVLLVYGFIYNPAGSFPTLWWVMAYLLLVGLWSALAAGAVLALVVIGQQSSQIMAQAANSLRSIGNWFRT
jgi:hypothetical protein